VIADVLPLLLAPTKSVVSSEKSTRTLANRRKFRISTKSICIALSPVPKFYYLLILITYQPAPTINVFSDNLPLPLFEKKAEKFQAVCNIHRIFLYFFMYRTKFSPCWCGAQRNTSQVQKMVLLAIFEKNTFLKT